MGAWDTLPDFKACQGTTQYRSSSATLWGLTAIQDPLGCVDRWPPGQRQHQEESCGSRDGSTCWAKGIG
ncbi:hypothetical protein SAMN05216466_106187 [Paraburkholderia phenazinium]|uniref:Uncharacterized protein n=1 Tax=Paraburkholderia phenazinium TaxID=60549 RepID=A0A1G7YI23_9BURK|nr:hypothetical protein SAMN05216466_106187 [Paraburkholderia phenazinium]